MKSHTDIEQSKKLAGFLPIESADMYYSNRTDITYQGALPIGWKRGLPLLSQEIPCWSLAALLNYLREIDFFPSIETDEHRVIMSVSYYDEGEGKLLNPVHDITTEADNFVDAAYAMIFKLHEQKIL